MIKRIAILICLSTLPFVFSIGADEPPKEPLQVAIYPFDAVGVNETVATVITNAVYRELLQSDKIVVRDQNSTAGAIKEIGFSQSGLCSEDACKIEAGKILKAQKLIMGTVEKVDENLFTVSIRVVDVQSAKTEFTTQDDCACTKNVEIRDFAVQLTNATLRIFLETGEKVKPVKKATVSLPPPAPKLEGILSLTSVPEGAKVIINGVENGITPLSLSLLPGLYNIELSMDGYLPELQQIQINQGEPRNVHITLKAVRPNTPQSNKKKEYLAVMDLNCGKIFKTGVCSALTDVAIEELIKSNAYTVVDRANRDKILQEVGFQMSGCVEAACMVEAGRLLGVSKIVTGSLSKPGNTYVVSLSLIDVSSVQIDAAVNENCSGADYDDLIAAVRAAVRKLL